MKDLCRTLSKTYSITHFSVNRNFVIQLKPVTLIYCLHWDRLRHAWHVSHLTGPISHVDLGHVGHIPQALHAVSVPGSHWFWQDLELQILPLPQILALCLKMHKSVNEDENIFYPSMIQWWVNFECLYYLSCISTFENFQSKFQICDTVVSNMCCMYFTYLLKSIWSNLHCKAECFQVLIWGLSLIKKKKMTMQHL